MIVSPNKFLFVSSIVSLGITFAFIRNIFVVVVAVVSSFSNVMIKPPINNDNAFIVWHDPHADI